MRKVTFNDLLNMPIEKEEIGIDNRMFYHWKFFDDEYSHRIDSTRLEQDARVKVKFIKNFCFDGRRTWELGYLTFDDKPVFFFYASGRDGCDTYGRAIVDDVLSNELEKYIISLCSFEDWEIEKSYALSDDATWITEFYQQSLFDEFKTW